MASIQSSIQLDAVKAIHANIDEVERRNNASLYRAGDWVGRGAWRALLDHQELLGHLLGRAWLLQVRPSLVAFSLNEEAH